MQGPVQSISPELFAYGIYLRWKWTRNSRKISCVLHFEYLPNRVVDNFGRNWTTKHFEDTANVLTILEEGANFV